MNQQRNSRRYFGLIMLTITFVACATRQQGADSQGQGPRQTVLGDDLKLGGATGRHLVLHVKGLRESETKSNDGTHRICGFALNGLDSPMSTREAQLTLDQTVCTSARDAQGVATLALRDVPYPAYVTVFHDENGNGVLDFATFDIIIARRTGPAEGVGALLFTDKETWPFSRPVWVELGEQTQDAQIYYGDLPFEATVKETLWQLFFGLYLRWGKELANPGNPGSPTNDPIANPDRL